MPLEFRTVHETTSSGPQTTPTKNEGFVSKYIVNPIKSVGSGIGTAAKWAWDNKAGITNAAGKVAKVAGAATGNPGLYIAGSGLEGLSNVIKEGEAKEALEKAIAERLPNPYRNLTYSDFPRIHYSRKPTGFKIYNTFAKHDLLYDNISNLRGSGEPIASGRSGTKYKNKKKGKK